MQETMKERAGTKRNRTGTLVVLALVVVAVAVVVIAVLARSGTRNMVKVPELAGKPFEQAAGDVAAVGLGIGEQAKLSSDSVPPGVVLGQLHKPGTLLRKGDTVLVTVSKGPMTTVPELTGFKRSDAAVELPKSHLVPGKVTTVPSAEIPPGRIVSLSPAPGTELMKGQPVNMVVSTAPPPPPVPASFVRPTLEMTSLEVGEPGEQGFNLAVGIAASNPNSTAGSIKGFYYKLEIDTFYLASAKQYCEMPLEPGARGAMLLNVNIRSDRLGKAAAGLLSRGEVGYRVRGYYILEAGGGRSIEPVAVSGTFNLADRLRPFLGRMYGSN